MAKALTEKIALGSNYAKGDRASDVARFNELIDKLGKVRVLDIGCKHDSMKFPGSVGLDILKSEGVDVVHDLEKFPYPFKDGHFNMIIANHVFEHINDLPPVMEEMYRILGSGGFLIVRTPFYMHHGAYDDPTHIRRFTLKTMDFFSIDSKWKLWGNDARFRIVHKKLFFGGEAINPGRFLLRYSERLYEKYLQHWFPGTCLLWVLEAAEREPKVKKVRK
ncbi:MAG: methyltransferase domain-containing protein [Thermodesulfobacteriota bacterium]